MPLIRCLVRGKAFEINQYFGASSAGLTAAVRLVCGSGQYNFLPKRSWVCCMISTDTINVGDFSGLLGAKESPFHSMWVGITGSLGARSDLGQDENPGCRTQRLCWLLMLLVRVRFQLVGALLLL